MAHFLRFACTLLVMGLFTGALLWGQQETGSITGQILDASAAPVPGARVAVKNQATAMTFSAQSDAGGIYRAPELAPGTYTITVTANGFSTLVQSGVEVRVDDRLRVDLTLQVGAVTEQIAVTATAPMLQTEDATAGQVIDTQNIVNLPLNGRNWVQLATLAAGAVTYVNSVDTQGGNQQNVRLNVGGLPASQLNYLIDGSDNSAYLGGGGAIAFPAVDSLQEFKVQTNDYTADTGRMGGAVINATIKSGSNAFHGSAYDFLRNRELNGRNFFASPAQVKPEFTRNQFGASLGGPFVKDKLFFFLNYDGTRQRQASTQTAEVFTAAQKAGDFSSALGQQIGVDALGRPIYGGEIYDPMSLNRLANGTAIRDPFPGNIIPGNRINPVSRQLINLVPPPNTSGAPNYAVNISIPVNIDTFVGRVDWAHSIKDSVFGHIVFSDQNSDQAGVLGTPLDGGTGVNLGSHQKQITIGWAHVLNPTNLNELRLGFVRGIRLTEAPSGEQDLNGQYGIPFPYNGAHVGGLANLAISGFATLGTNVSSPFFQYTDKYEISDSYTAIRGSHSLKFAVRGALKLFYNQKNSNYGRGYLTFTGNYTQQVGVSNTGNGAADFLTGVANFAEVGNVTNAKPVGQDIEWYAQDRWQVTRKLTITFGIHYTFDPNDWESRDNITNVVFGPGYGNARIVVPPGMPQSTFQFIQNTLLPAIPVERAMGLNRGLTYNSNLNFAPRLGIAYQIVPKTVLRTGYGIYYGFPDEATDLDVNPPAKLLISSSSNGIDPTIFINQSAFGANPFNRALTNPSFIESRDTYMPPSVTQMYNLNLQRELGHGWLAEIGFMGNRSSRVLVNLDINDAAPALPSDTSSTQTRRRVSTILGPVNWLAPEGFSNYNALTVNVEKRFSDGLSVVANYTWSRALGVAPPYQSGINTTPVEDPTNLKREYGPLEFDIVGRVSIAHLYELPFGKGKRFLSHLSRPAEMLLGGWQVNGITTLQGGFPVTPVLGLSLGRTDTNSRPDAIGDPNNSRRQPDNWLNPAAFSIPSNAAIAAGDFFGNAGRASVREPGLVNFDESLFKSFPLHESISLQFRAEIFNVTNTPFFGLPSGLGLTFGSATFGKVLSAGDPRVVQLALKLLF